MSDGYHEMIKRLLDGELRLADLPPALRAEGEEALRWLAALDRTPVRLSDALDARVMASVRRRAASPARRAWRWLSGAREVRVRLHPWRVGLLAAAATVLVIVVGGPQRAAAPASGTERAFVRFALFAPDARQVTVAGTFNQWDYTAAPLLRPAANGLWVATLAVPVGQHQYVFIVDGNRVVTDPSAPSVDDGFGSRNSVLAVSAQGAAL